MQGVSMIELLRTKLFIPRPRKNLVSRSRLVDCLNTGSDRKLTLIAAPAGFGKTTLLSEWIPQSPCCVTWLSLDDADNDPVKFWAYFIRSLQELRPDLGESALDLLQALQTSQITSVITSLINDIASFPDMFAVVLDDYHVIDSPAIHQGLTFLIDHLPTNMHLVITTRVDPPLPLARMRVQDKLTEIRANDLRFTVDESASFLRQVMGFDLSADEVAALETRTEGWIAGLQIAALSMRDRDDLFSFIQAFSGSHRHILGYLADEVLDQQTQQTLNFLLQTSVLGRLCGPLCDTITGESGGQIILESLEHANLFIIPLDDESKWYRYHHLFAEVLQARLLKDHPELLPELHLRASEWYESEGFVAEAVGHALAAGTVEQAARLIERYRWVLLGRGEAYTLRRWLDTLQPESFRSRPGLSLAYAWTLSLLEQPEAIETRLLDAESALAELDSGSTQPDTEDKNTIRGEIATLRAEVALSQLDVSGAITLCRQALRLLPEANQMMRGVTTYFLGHGERRKGNMLEAERAYVAASNLGLQTDNLLLALHALSNLTSVQIAQGRLEEAARTSHKILEITAERQRQSWPVAGLAYQGLGRLYYEWNELETANRYLRQGIEYGENGGLIGLEINSRNMLAFTLEAQGHSNDADEMLKEVAVINERNHHPIYTAEAAAWEARLRLRQGRLEPGIVWADSCGLNVNDLNIPYSRAEEYLTLARVCIARGRLEGVAGMLERLQRSAEDDKRNGDRLEIVLQKALLLQARNHTTQAVQLLEPIIALAEPEGFIRSFVDEGEPMRLLLLELQSTLKKKIGSETEGGVIHLFRYIQEVLTAFSQPAPLAASRQDLTPEPLSERELDILRLIAAGRSNQEIAGILVIAVSTVKTHINNLYGKLGTNRRTEAIAIARQRGLLKE
jgi:LuxR family transcriptional regulator, maltose regulon positive regulatory protein